MAYKWLKHAIYFHSLFFFGSSSFRYQNVQLLHLACSLQFKLLHNCTFSKPGIINKIIIQLQLISIRCDEVGEAWLFLTGNRVVSFIYIMPWGFLHSTTNQQTKIISLSAQGQKSPYPRSLQTERIQEETSRKKQKCRVFCISKCAVSLSHCTHISASVATMTRGPWLNAVSSCSLPPVPVALLNLEQLLLLWRKTGKGVLLQVLS